jgi:mycoredoxin
MNDEHPADGIVVYWRPGCMFCSSLFRQLERHGVPHDRVNIWDDEHAAAVVRHAAQGHETVPTVAVGSVMLVNPSVHTVLREAATHAPEAVPQTYEPPQPGRFRRWLLVKLSGD